VSFVSAISAGIKILYYGKVKVDKDQYFDYIITPIYDTEFWKMEYDQKMSFAKNLACLGFTQ
jgi:hypothetical protein